jgi:hypothetical protein
MRIIIDVDGDNVNVTTEPAHKISVNSDLVALVASPRPTPPPELLTAAAALGAHDAGPAPAHLASLVRSVNAAEWKAITGPSDAGAAPAGRGRKTTIKRVTTKPAARYKKR